MLVSDPVIIARQKTLQQGWCEKREIELRLRAAVVLMVRSLGEKCTYLWTSSVGISSEIEVVVYRPNPFTNSNGKWP